MIEVRKRNKSKSGLILLFAAALLLSCGNEILVDANTEFEMESWNVKQSFSTKFDVNDTVNDYNFFITLRNTDEYPYQNLFVFLNTEFPNGKHKIDTINCPLASPQGKWLGKGFAGIYDNRVLYMAKKRFPLSGSYSIKIDQAMRDTLLPGILDVGVRIEKAK